MGEFEIFAECVVKLEEIKQEADDPVEEYDWNSTEFVESSTLDSVVKEEDSEEELQSVASVFVELQDDIKVEVEEVEEEYEDPLESCGEGLGVAHDVKAQGPWIPDGEWSTTNTFHEEPLGRQSAPRTFSRQLSGADGVSTVAPAKESSKEGVPARNVPGENAFKCNLCSRNFMQKINLEIHTQIHAGKPYHCPLCPKCFRQTKGFLVHMQSAHRTLEIRDVYPEEKPFVCSVCSKTFCHRGHLNQHMQSHTSKRLHYCTVCQKGFKRKNHVVYHHRMHSGERPYPCTLCSKRFRTNSHLVNHMRTHTGEKPYPCSVCEKRFSLPGNLTTHMKTHQIRFVEKIEVKSSQ